MRRITYQIAHDELYYAEGDWHYLFRLLLFLITGRTYFSRMCTREIDRIASSEEYTG